MLNPACFFDIHVPNTRDTNETRDVSNKRTQLSQGEPLSNGACNDNVRPCFSEVGTCSVVTNMGAATMK